MRALIWCFLFLLIAGIFLWFVIPLLKVVIIGGTVLPQNFNYSLNTRYSQNLTIISLNYSYIYSTGINLRFNATNLTVDLHKNKVPILIETPNGERFYDLIWKLLGYDAWQIRPSQYFMIVNLSRFVGLKTYNAHSKEVKYGTLTQKKSETFYFLQPIPVDYNDSERYSNTIVLVNITTLKPCNCQMTYPPSANITYTYTAKEVDTIKVTADASVYLYGYSSCSKKADIIWYLVVNGRSICYSVSTGLNPGTYTNVYWNGWGPLCKVIIKKEYHYIGNHTWCSYSVTKKTRTLVFKVYKYKYDFTFTIFNGSNVQRTIPIYTAVNRTVVWVKKLNGHKQIACDHNASYVTPVTPPKVQKFNFTKEVTETVEAWECFKENYSFYVWDNPYVPSYGKNRLRKFWIGNITVYYHVDDTSLPDWDSSKTYSTVVDITPHLRQAPPWVYNWTKPVIPHTYGVVNIPEDYAKDYLLYVTALCLNKSLYEFAKRTLAKHGLSDYIPFEVFWLIQQIPMHIPLNISVKTHPIDALYEPKKGYLAPNLLMYYLLSTAIPLNSSLYNQNNKIYEIYYNGTYYHGLYIPNSNAGLAPHNISAVILAYLPDSAIPETWNNTVYFGHIYTIPRGQLFIVDATYQKSPCAEWVTISRDGSVILMFPNIPRAGSRIVLTKGWKPIPTFASFNSTTQTVTITKYYVTNWKSYVGARNFTTYESYLH